MKLYFSPGACSQSPHIVLRESGAAFDLVRVDTKTKQTKDGADFLKVNPKGMVPALELDNGEVLTEGPAIVQYIADSQGHTGLMPAAGTPERYRVLEWLNFITSEVHKTFSPLFNPKTPEEYKATLKETLAKRFAHVDKALAGKSYLTGETFTAADAYLFVVTNWSRFHNIDISQWPNLKAFMERVAARPKVRETLEAEGLIRKAA